MGSLTAFEDENISFREWVVLAVALKEQIVCIETLLVYPSYDQLHSGAKKSENESNIRNHGNVRI